METIHTIGRRKTAVARIYLSEGKGQVKINNKDLKVYFPTPSLQYTVNRPFGVTQTEGKYDIKATVQGGGSNGQAEAIRLGIARALCKINETEYRPLLKPEKLLTRDPRMVERKKFGLRKARKRDQFSKR